MYRGSGILFVDGLYDPGCRIFLMCRKRSKIWSIPGGGWSPHDVSAWNTAMRETREELGIAADEQRVAFSQRYLFGVARFDWETFVVAQNDFDDGSRGRDYHREFCGSQWFPLNRLPRRTHLLLYPILVRLRVAPVIHRLRRPGRR